MAISIAAQKILSEINPQTKLGELRTRAKEIKKDHALAMELWSSARFMPRMQAILIFDPKRMNETDLLKMDADMQKHTYDERTQLMDWLMANVITKSKTLVSALNEWSEAASPLQRRAYWYNQGRLRWVGQTAPANTDALLTEIESRITQEPPEVQWAMNFTAGWMGVYEKKFRTRCVNLGKRTGLYKDEMVSKGCTPSYLPEFISIEAKKRNL